ncbi:protein adenylyltransferase SelO [Brevibacillus porteri]|uniref:Protein nucleotidyltransferase YdiU n=1 Tax=Brevibacillus porteri TaxID=2126350 RepID=A0ABX5FW59_9BACL|nr:YdiU family protein [Brevibacillus porteri]MED1799219.1 YdiU family protein [Brevibacillus porteri]MED2132393.1 YdiU family protein [Brevibacillus porteri]MED2744477.1 YdiU family protein [Brevibacillus porteri]MED2814921.1 YdiU family protein [Brevibacillus porteri]MED2895634.1 YdiU family protein [Brevibacillus porteri]
MTDKKATIELGWNFDNSYTTLPKSFYSRLSPPPVHSPKLAILNESLAKSLGLNAEALQSTDAVAMLAGNEAPEGAMPIAQAYAGHQFGHFTMLGDGRALLLGEQITPSGERFDIQLKGSGRTPYSRGGDGRAALGPMLREYIISEAMHGLGIPTTRSLAVVTTGESIYRESELPGAILTRVAASHIRVGTFQFAARWCSIEDLRALADYTLQRHFPEIETEENRYLLLLKGVIKRQAELIAKWQLVGFIHGVMNTDNMAISGETIDYGPCAFMDTYDPATVFSSIDVQGRYAYGNQPYIAVWNLSRFAETLLPLLHENEAQAVKMAEDALGEFSKLYHSNWLRGMRAKLGLFNEEEQDEALIVGLLNMMKEHRADYTNTFRALTINQPEGTVLFGTSEFTEWHEQWKARLTRQPEDIEAVQQVMKNSNPAVIPRNHRVEEALEAAWKEGDNTVMERLLAVLSDPYAYTPEQVAYTTLPAESARPYQTFCGT